MSHYLSSQMNVIPLNTYASDLEKIVKKKKQEESHSVRQKNLTHMTHEVKVETGPEWANIRKACKFGKDETLDEKTLEKQTNLTTLVDQCATPDQARLIMKLFSELENGNINSTVSVMAARGRGKSAAMGIAIGAALKLGFTNIFVSAAHPSNVATLFEFAVKSLKAFGFVEGADFITEVKDLDQMDKYRRLAHDGRFRHHTQQVMY